MKALLGWIIFLFTWWIFSYFEVITPFVLPTPLSVVNTFVVLMSENKIIPNMLFSIRINILGYLIAIITAIPIGFLLGLFNTTRQLFSNQIDSLRFVPITALGGLFIALFHLSDSGKTAFLAFGIWVYLVPVVVQRIDEVSLIHLQMIKTLGASKWQTFRYVQFPYVMSRLSDDVRILVGISWTYIIVAELANATGGLGYLIFLGERQSNPSVVYICVIIIIIIGALQDRIFKLIDKLIFKYKYI